MEGQPVSIGGNWIAGPVVTQVVLSFPRGIHDQVIRPRRDLQGEQAHGEERLDELVALCGLRGIVDGITQIATDRSNELFDAMAIAFQDRVLEIEWQVAGGSGGPILTLGCPIALGKGNPVFGHGDGFDRPGFSRAGGAADVELGLGSEIRRTRIAGEGCGLRWGLDLTM